MSRGPVDLQAEARRRRAVADDARERLAALEQRHADAQEACFPGGPGPKEIEDATEIWKDAEAAAGLAAKLVERAAAMIDPARVDRLFRYLLGLADEGETSRERFDSRMKQFAAEQCATEAEIRAALEQFDERATSAIRRAMMDVPTVGRA